MKAFRKNIELYKEYHACTHACTHTCMHAHTHNRFMALWILSGTTQVSQYQKGRTNLDSLEQEILGSMQICSG